MRQSIRPHQCTGSQEWTCGTSSLSFFPVTFRENYSRASAERCKQAHLSFSQIFKIHCALAIMFFHSFVACVGQDSNVGALYLFRRSPIIESNQRSDTNGTNTTSWERKLWPLGVGHPGVCEREGSVKRIYVFPAAPSDPGMCRRPSVRQHTTHGDGRRSQWRSQWLDGLRPGEILPPAYGRSAHGWQEGWLLTGKAS
jgi:hypothetical protein